MTRLPLSPAALLLACAAVVLLLLCCASVVPAAAQTCLDERGEAVDWFVIIKMPKDVSSSDPGIAAGLGYMYGDAHSHATPSAFWSSSAGGSTLGDATSSAGRTLSQIYAEAKSTTAGHIMYNDELPNDGPVSDTYGHTKGMLAWSTAGKGFWLIHSVPKYAASPEMGETTYAYPATAIDYGQSMLCISMNLANVDLAFLQFQYNNPQVYGSKWVTSLAAQLPHGNAFVNGGSVTKTAASSIANITSLGGVRFTHLAKTSKWDQDIFGNLIGPYYNQGLLTETWERPYENPLLPPQSKEPVYTVLTLQTPSTVFGGHPWKEGDDHSKWAVSMSKTLPVLCIGDINKQVSQWTRSGGLACIVDATMHAVYTQLILTTDQSGTAEEQEELKLLSPRVAAE